METIFFCQPATSPSWVTVTIVVLKSRLSSKSKFIHFLLLSMSKDAVGSSHKINLGLIMIALAKTVLAFSPSDFP